MTSALFRYSLTFFFLVLLLNTLDASANAESWKLFSPNNRICFHLNINKNQQGNSTLSYEVDWVEKGKVIKVIEPSSLGIDRSDEQFTRNLSFVSASQIMKIDDQYQMKIGRQTRIRNLANEISLTFKNKNNSMLRIDVRAYNDGVAFRYVFPEKSEDSVSVLKELTTFKVQQNGKCWIQPYDKPTKWTPSYELYYQNGIPIGTTSPNVEGWAFPALFNVGDIWTLISEANLTLSYCGSRLEQIAPNGLYSIRFPDLKDGESTGNVNPSSTLPWVMPWRTIIIGNTLSTIYESQLINSVSDKQIAGDFSWVKPGRASWSWITDPPSSKNYNSLKKFVDLAATMKWEYSLVDANWETMEGGNIKQLVDYANSKNVGILMWYNSGGPNNTISEGPRDIIYDTSRRKAEFKKLHEWGVKGVKIDFWQSDKQNMIQLYHDVLIDAAENQILVNFHGCTLPRGWSRTYPNLISHEAVKGEECYLFDSTYTDNAPIQNTILPFSRNVVGPMDYTPFGIKNLKFPHKTTETHELALALVFNTGIIHFAVDEESCLALPQFVKKFLNDLPVTFDETHLVSGYPGKDVVVALRSGKDWFLAGINGESVSKTIHAKLPFIKGVFDVSSIEDGVGEKEFILRQKNFKTNDLLNLKMPEFGGFVAKFKFKNN